MKLFIKPAVTAASLFLSWHHEASTEKYLPNLK